MSRSTFMELTVPELTEVLKCWQESRRVSERTPWEVMRVQVAMTLQPFVKGKLDPYRIFPLPWDRDTQTHRVHDKAVRKRQQKRLSNYLKTGRWD